MCHRCPSIKATLQCSEEGRLTGGTPWSCFATHRLAQWPRAGTLLRFVLCPVLSCVEQSRRTSPRVTSTTATEAAQSNNEAGPTEGLADPLKRVEHLQATVRPQKTTAKSNAT